MNEVDHILEINDIIRILPQKPPAILVDRIVEIEPGVRLVATKNVTVSEPFFDGHYPGQPIMPNTTVIELMVQSSIVFMYATERFEPVSKIVTMMGINKAKFHRAIVPGHVLEIQVELAKRRTNVWRLDCKLYEQDQRIAECELVLSIRNRDDVM